MAFLKLVAAVLIFDRALIEAKNSDIEPWIVGQAATSPAVYLMSSLQNNWPAEAYANFTACLIEMLSNRNGRKISGLSTGKVLTPPMAGGSA